MEEELLCQGEQTILELFMYGGSVPPHSRAEQQPSLQFPLLVTRLPAAPMTLINQTLQFYLLKS